MIPTKIVHGTPNILNPFSVEKPTWDIFFLKRKEVRPGPDLVSDLTWGKVTLPTGTNILIKKDGMFYLCQGISDGHFL